MANLFSDPWFYIHAAIPVAVLICGIAYAIGTMPRRNSRRYR